MYALQPAHEYHKYIHTYKNKSKYTNIKTRIHTHIHKYIHISINSRSWQPYTSSVPNANVETLKCNHANQFLGAGACFTTVLAALIQMLPHFGKALKIAHDWPLQAFARHPRCRAKACRRHGSVPRNIEKYFFL